MKKTGACKQLYDDNCRYLLNQIGGFARLYAVSDSYYRNLAVKCHDLFALEERERFSVWLHVYVRTLAMFPRVDSYRLGFTLDVTLI